MSVSEAARAAAKIGVADALRILSRASERLAAARQLQNVADEILAAALGMLEADAGCVTILALTSDAAPVTAATAPDAAGFEPFAILHPAQAGASRILVENAASEACFSSLAAQAARLGFASAQATWLIASDGTVLGALSAGRRTPGRPSDAALDCLDILMRHGAAIVERLRNAEEAQAMEKRSEAFLNHSEIVAWLKREDGRYVYLNPRLQSRCLAFGSDWKDKNDFEIWPHGVAQAFHDADQRTLALGNLELEEFTPDEQGGGTWWLANKFSYRDRFGERFVGGVAVDITERKRSEAALRERELLSRTLLQALGDGVFVARDDRFLYANDRLPAMLGYSFEDFLALRVTQVIAPQDAALLKQPVDCGSDLVAAQEFLTTARLRDGSPLDAEISARPMLYNGAPAVLGVLRDVTRRREADLALKRSEAWFRTIFQHAATGIVLYDMGRRVTRANPAYCRLLGYSEEEILTLGVADLVHPDDFPQNDEEIERLLSGEISSFEIENRYVRKDGAAVWGRKFLSLLRDGEGRPTHIMALVTDVSERRALVASLREADRRKDEFLATLAHELRNPLASISSAVHLMRRQAEAPSPLREASLLTTVDKQIAHLVRLVDDLLEVSRITRGVIELKRERVDLRRILNEAIETCAPLLESGRHETNLSLGDAACLVEGDPVRLAQIFVNLVNNAAKYTPPGGKIDVELERAAAHVILRVRDNGVGIPSDMLTKIFDLFAQIEPASARSQGGIGVGLALARSLVELHGGDIVATSAGPGRGSEFIVRLPFQDAGSPPVVEDAPSAASAQRQRVLVVDDDRTLADLTAQLIESFGMETRVAYSGEDGVAAMNDFEPRLVFLDLGMPKMDGYETARRIRATAQGKRAVLAALSGWGQAEDRRKSEEAGFDAHFVKPIKIRALEEILESIDTLADAKRQ